MVTTPPTGDLGTSLYQPRHTTPCSWNRELEVNSLWAVPLEVSGINTVLRIDIDLTSIREWCIASL